MNETLDRRSLGRTSNLARTRLVRTGLAAAALAGSLLAANPVAADRVGIAGPHASGGRAASCRGQAATHVNEDGGPGNDVIVVTEPGLEVDAWNGDDLICVSTGRTGYGASINGGNGQDTIITYSGENFVYAGADADSVLSNSADHLLDGEDGNDTIYLGTHPDVTVYGGTGHDRIFGSPASDVINAGDGNDLVLGFDGDDQLIGAVGDDRLEGGAGTDVLDGSAGVDTCVDVAAPLTTFTACDVVVGLLLEPADDFVQP